MGNIGKAQNLDRFVEAFAKIKSVKIWHVHVVGTGSYIADLKMLVEEKNLDDRFIFHGRHPVEEMPKFYSIADACFMGLIGTSIIGHTIPNKLQGYMAAGKTVIAAIDGAAQKVIRDAKCGIAVPADNVNALADGIQDFIDYPEKYKDCGENGRKYFKQHFHKTIHLDLIEKAMKQLLEG